MTDTIRFASATTTETSIREAVRDLVDQVRQQVGVPADADVRKMTPGRSQIVAAFTVRAVDKRDQLTQSDRHPYIYAENCTLIC